MNAITFECGDSTIEFVKNEWDSLAFSRRCFDLRCVFGTVAPSVASFKKFVCDNNIQTMTCRLSPLDEDASRLMRHLGFYHVELQLNCKLVLARCPPTLRKFGELRLAKPDDQKAVLKISGDMFLQTRFKHVSGVEPAEIASRFQNWTEQLHSEAPDFAYVLENNDAIVGFFYSKPTDSPGELYAALGGISTEVRGPFGYYLYPAVMQAYWDSGIRSVVSAIAADNLGALNLWASLGTKFPAAVDFYMLNAEELS